MTEWTFDLILPPADPDEVGPVDVVEAVPDAPYPDLVAASVLIDDDQLDRVDWFA